MIVSRPRHETVRQVGIGVDATKYDTRHAPGRRFVGEDDRSGIGA